MSLTELQIIYCRVKNMSLEEFEVWLENTQVYDEGYNQGYRDAHHGGYSEGYAHGLDDGAEE